MPGFWNLPKLELITKITEPIPGTTGPETIPVAKPDPNAGKEITLIDEPDSKPLITLVPTGDELGTSKPYMEDAVSVDAKTERYVHIAPKSAEKVILKQGLNKDLSTYVTKMKYIDNKKAKDFEKILYRKDLQDSKVGKFDEGAVIFEINSNAANPKYKGLTNMENKVRQWQYKNDVPAKNIKKIKEVY